MEGGKAVASDDEGSSEREKEEFLGVKLKRGVAVGKKRRSLHSGTHLEVGSARLFRERTERPEEEFGVGAEAGSEPMGEPGLGALRSDEPERRQAPTTKGREGD